MSFGAENEFYNDLMRKMEKEYCRWHDWDELHKCKKCGKLFVLRNGCL